jgi:1-acyl-sn-glycerol-3-phosphate acyltransferase
MPSPRLPGMILVGDAEIIPLGTRGRPGRGTGSTTPSSRSRDLAVPGARAEARQQHPSVRVPAQKRTAGPAAPLDDQREAETSAPKSEPKSDRQSASIRSSDQGETMTEPTSGAGVPRLRRRAPVTAEHRDPGKGIPPLEWLAAFTSASKEIFGENWEPRLAEFLAFLRRRLTGDFTVDDYGFDREVTEQFLVAALRPIARRWFRIEVRGAENIPTEGGALVVSNHSGTVPVDGLMTAVSIHDHTQRFLRPLGADLVFKLPVVGDLARKGGATLACTEDAERMLRGGELVGVWPEGFKGIGKPFSERYKLQRFGRGGFVSAALRTGVPIIPTSVVGAEEIYPLVGNIPSLARLLGVPYIPITPLFPLLGPLGLIPLPSKWLIEFGEPIRTDSYDEGAADDPMLVFNVTDQVRESIQQTLYSLLMQRKSVFS